MKKSNTLLRLFVFGIFLITFPAENSAQNPGEPAPRDLIFVDLRLGAVLGGFENGGFTKAKKAAENFASARRFSLYDERGANVENNLPLLKSSEQMDEICPDFVAVENAGTVKSGVAVSSEIKWNPAPRRATSIDPNNRIYRDAVRKMLAAKGIARPVVKIQKILRVDLEGDGQDEILIEANNRPEDLSPAIKSGDYSFIMLRKIVSGKVREILLAGDFRTKNAEFDVFYDYRISSILDIDGDGTLEILLYGAYYEGAWAEAHKITGGKTSKVLETGCGV